jgi:hypothetical protein
MSYYGYKERGMRALWNCIKGMNGGICIIAGAPASGKTLLLCRICESIVKNRVALKDRVALVGVDNFFDLDIKMLSSQQKYRVTTNMEIARNRLAVIAGEEIVGQTKYVDTDIITDVIDGHQSFMDSILSFNTVVTDLMRRRYRDILINVEFNNLPVSDGNGIASQAKDISAFMSSTGNCLRSHGVNLYLCAATNRNVRDGERATAIIRGGISVVHGANIIIKVSKEYKMIKVDVIKHRHSGGVSNNNSRFEFPIPNIHTMVGQLVR